MKYTKTISDLYEYNEELEDEKINIANDETREELLIKVAAEIFEEAVKDIISYDSVTDKMSDSVKESYRDAVFKNATTLIEESVEVISNYQTELNKEKVKEELEDYINDCSFAFFYER